MAQFVFSLSSFFAHLTTILLKQIKFHRNATICIFSADFFFFTFKFNPHLNKAQPSLKQIASFYPNYIIISISLLRALTSAFSFHYQTLSYLRIYLVSLLFIRRNRLESNSEHWNALLLSLRELTEWVIRKDTEQSSLSVGPLMGDAASLQKQLVSVLLPKSVK